jgi:exopolysaccharide biosynthesis polyprenyl glycosylphosphotransferase
MGIQPLDISSAAHTSAPIASGRAALLSRRPVKTGLFMLGDLLALSASYYSAAFLARIVFHVACESVGRSAYPMFFLPFCAGVFYLMDGYGIAELRRPERELELTVKGVSFCLLSLLAANAILLKGEMFSRYFVLLWYGFALSLVLAERFFLRAAYGWAWRRGYALNRALFVGKARELDHFQQMLSLQRHRAYQLVATITLDSSNAYGTVEQCAPMLLDWSQWENVVEHQKIQVLILGGSLSNYGEDIVSAVLADCSRRKLDITLLTDALYPSEMHREFDHFTASSYFTPAARWHRALQLFCKRSIDFLFGVTGSLVTIILMPLIGLLVYLEDRGPVFHLREYVSCDGTTRYYRKFRTMVCNADEILQKDSDLKSRFASNHKLQDDPRVLRVGRLLRKYSIDEFPQFFSLLSGRLSLVGPRVISLEEIGRYGEFLAKRLSVKPGMTGYWQVMGRQTTTYDERVRMDEFYIEHWSIWLDLYIIAKTFGKLVRPEGAC